MTDVLQSSLQLSRESSVMSDISSSSRTSLKIQKKIERATQKKLALEEEGPKYPDSKKRKCPFCGKLGHISKANKECDHHAEYVKQPAKSKFTIKTSLKNTINLANGDMNTSFCESVQKFVRHCRDVTSVTSLFFNFVNMELLEQDQPLPPFSHTRLYDCASLIMELGTKAPDTLKNSYNRFKQVMSSDYDMTKFTSQGYSPAITELMRSFSTVCYNHVADNFKKRTLRYFLTVMSSAEDEYYISCSITNKRTLSEKIFESLSQQQELEFPESMNLTENQKRIVRKLKTNSSQKMGPAPYTEATVGARPHLYTPWLYHILKQMEKAIHIKEPVPQKKASKGFVHRKIVELINMKTLPRQFQHTLEHHILDCINSSTPKEKFVNRNFTKQTKISKKTMNEVSKSKGRDLTSEEKLILDRFVEDTREEIITNTFRPSKYTDPRGARLFTVLPVYSLQVRHVPINEKVLKKLLKNQGVNYKNKSYPRICFDTFNMKKVGFQDFEQLEGDKKKFVGVMRTDGVDLEFICERPRVKAGPELTPSDVEAKINLSNATIWGVDPGLTDIFFASDDHEIPNRHRIRKTSTAEYYQLAGFKKSRLSRAKIDKDRMDERRILSQSPSLKTSSFDNYTASVKYILRNYGQLTSYYDNQFIFTKLKFRNYINKQKALTEISKRLLSGSRKYSVQTDIIDSTKKWKKRSPVDADDERAKPVVIAFGGAQFGNLRGNVPAPTKKVKVVLQQMVKERNKKTPTFLVMIDEYLTSQICPKCNTRTTVNERSNITGSEIHSVLKCNTCETHWNRDHMASMNMRSVFLYMAFNNNRRPSAFRREGS